MNSTRIKISSNLKSLFSRRRVALILFVFAVAGTQGQCKYENKAFVGGENLQYRLYFNWKFIWIKAGTANLSIDSVSYNRKPAYRCGLITRGSKRTDKFFMMRDTLLAYITPNLVPLYYRKGALEGKSHNVDEAWYSYNDGKINIRHRFINNDGEVSTNESSSDECAYDMVSMLMRARSFDPTDYKPGMKLRFPMADGKRVKEETLIYRGKKDFKMENTDTTYHCLVFSFVEYVGKKNKEKEVVTFYITDDKNHLPVRLDLFLRFGTAKAFLTSASGLRWPQTSVVKK
ncbi:MAG: DUF3108 domain-containing protein [Bacteroidaceae bacterium]|nr:DUF3108 domain-containing protein [Bacteroidaceae bacterium]